MKKTLLFVFVLVVFLSMVGCTPKKATEPETTGADSQKNTAVADVSAKNVLWVYSGAGLKKPVTEIAERFKEKNGVDVQLVFGGSAQLLAQVELSQKGDVMLLGSLDTYTIASEKKLVGPALQVAYHVPVIGVPAGNPAGITTLADLSKPNVKVILGDESACAIGKSAQRIFETASLQNINENVVAKTATVNELIVHLEMRDADAAIITADQTINNEAVEMIPIDQAINSVETIPVCTLTLSKNPETAQAFIEYVASEEGTAIFEKWGFPPVGED